MTPTEILKHEHKIILLVLDAAEQAVVSIKAGGEVKVTEIETMLEFFINFADRQLAFFFDDKFLFVPLVKNYYELFRICLNNSQKQ